MIKLEVKIKQTNIGLEIQKRIKEKGKHTNIEEAIILYISKEMDKVLKNTEKKLKKAIKEQEKEINDSNNVWEN